MRFSALDLLRGLVILLMALDHVRDFFSAAAFEPTDLARTTPAWFLTRWVTHFCAPAFILLAGVGAYLWASRGRSTGQLARLLATRGLWLIALEVLVITPLGWSLQWDLRFVRLQVIWVIGLSMLLTSPLVLLPSRWLGGLGLAMIALHNATDGWRQPVWAWLHSIQFQRFESGQTVASLYPLVPWWGVLLLGYAMGEVWLWPAARRQQWLGRAGSAALLVFVVLRGFNLYGDPVPWQASWLSFLNVAKYPPSLSYLLITLGAALLALRWLERWTLPGPVHNVLLGFGRVPLFFYLLHLPVIHAAAIVYSWLRHGSAAWLWQDPFFLRRPPSPAPADYGLGLTGLYLVWLATLLLLYPLARRYGAFKASQKHWFWTYL